ncbi:FxSxx-COOH system tetratricopeptide repeat protein [Micromonospora sp. CB01531]|uniref:FxSxx-COOH system tetratricopeptide repeat protein n=1 Tax=Micromonospora sp. CB01531 TaxID=1718947 RepID=UPI000A5EF283|nr:FxSxx-COOH system tetratricopeptide repeat protein [Micromonospora sp. CB01531]
MPRPERPLYPDLDPLHAFAQRLRDARREAGNPKYDAMARQTGRSSTALSEAAGGDHLPTWETVVAYVSSCRQDPNAYRLEWERNRDLRDGTTAPPRSSELARLSNLPRRPAGVFLGRSRALDALHRLLEPSGQRVGAAVYGLGGVGKTELALQYVERNRSRYAPLWWVTADTEENLTKGLAEFARTVQPDWPASGSAADAAAWALRWFASHDDWLLVLDNVTEPGTVAATLAAAVRGRVIVTSRRELDWDALALAPLRLDVLRREDSVNVILERSTRHGERAEIEQLAADLADLPLALTHAGAYLVERGHVTAAEYQRRLAEQPTAVLGVRALAHPADAPVARTWLVTIEAMRADDPLSVALLDVMAYFAPEAVPVEVLSRAGGDAVAVDDALAVAASYSLIARSGPEVSVHRLVQTVIRAHHTGSGHRAAAVDLLLAALPTGDPESSVKSWPRWGRLVPHIEALAGLLRMLPSLPDDLVVRAAELFGLCALYQRGQGRYSSALALLRQAADALNRILGPERPDTVTAMYRLAGGLWSAGRYAEAMQLGESTWHARRRLLGPDHPDTLANASYVALGYRETGRYEEALTLTASTLAARERVLGADHPETLQSRNNLAGCYRALGKHDDALALYESTLGSRLLVLGPTHPDTLQSQHNLAGGYLAVGRSEDAVTCYEATLASRRSILGSEHPDTLHTQHLLAGAYEKIGRTADADTMYQATLRSRRRLLGPAHPDTRRSEAALAQARGAAAGDPTSAIGNDHVQEPGHRPEPLRGP